MPSGSRLALVSLLVVLVAGPVAAQPLGGSAVAPPDATDAGPSAIDAGVPGAAAVAAPDAPGYNTTMRVQLTNGGDARWEVTTTVNLTDEADRAAFSDLAASFESGQTTTEWVTGFRQAATRAGRATARNMRIEAVRRSSVPPANETGPGTGRLTLSFTWTNFADASDGGESLAVGDVFESTSPPLLAELGPRETLIVAPPDGYTPVTGSGDLREGSFYWEGPQDFTDEPPSAVYRGGGPPTLTMAALVVAGLALLLVFVYLVASRRGTIVDRGDDESGTGAAAAAGEEETAEGRRDDGAESGGDGGTDDSDDEIDVELLSDEERVERLLNRNGGRMKQASIVKETGWSNAKVSQLLSAMEEDGRIDKLRIGRENLISFPDEDVADVEE